MRSSSSRLTIEGTTQTDDLAALAEDVRSGLSAQNKRLPCQYIYDDRGSDLFVKICSQPEYYLTRAERQILEQHAQDIVSDLSPDTTIVELGSGSSEKTDVLIGAFLEAHGHLHYVPIDISEDALDQAASRILEQFDNVEITAFAGDYNAGLEFVSERFGGPTLVLFLGSSIGNFARDAARSMLGRVAEVLAPEDGVLMGVDLRKDRATLEAAYDDAGGVTAAFNRNILERVNRELGGEFDIKNFDYKAEYSESKGRVEMFQVSKLDQEVTIADLDMTVRLGAGERIHTENSHKYSQAEIDDLTAAAGLTLQKRWFDKRRRYTLNHVVPVTDANRAHGDSVESGSPSVE